MTLKEFSEQCKNSSVTGVRLAWERLFPAAVVLLRLKLRQGFYTLLEPEFDQLIAARQEFESARSYMEETCRMNKISDVPDLSASCFGDWLLQY